MRSRTSVLSACLLLLALAAGACAPAPETVEPPAPEIDLAAAREALLSADRAWAEAYATSDDPVEVFALNVTANAYLLPPDAPMVKGRLAIREVIESMEAIEGFSVTWEPVDAAVSAGADLGYTIGTFEMTVPGEGGPATVSGKYLTVWQVQDDGTWMVTADMFNADGPPVPAGG